jgi:hypothetical protein
MTPLVYTAAVLSLLLVGSRAGAEPLAIRSGLVTFTDEPGAVSLAGDGFAIQGEWFPRTLRGTFWFDQCRPCEPGQVVDFGTTTYGFSASDLAIGPSSGVVRGTAYTELFVDAELTFSGPRVRAPLDVQVHPNAVSGPFGMEGRISAYLDRSRAAPPVFAADLHGFGTADVRFQTDFLLSDIDFRFADPIPEPSTLLLLGMGSATGAARLKKGAARRHDTRP